MTYEGCERQESSCPVSLGRVLTLKDNILPTKEKASCTDGQGVPREIGSGWLILGRGKYRWEKEGILSLIAHIRL